LNFVKYPKYYERKVLDKVPFNYSKGNPFADLKTGQRPILNLQWCKTKYFVSNMLVMICKGLILGISNNIFSPFNISIMSSRPAMQFSDVRNSIFSGYVQSNIYGPLMHKYPNAQLPHNSGTLTGLHPNPPKFQSDDSSGTVANSRFQYINTSSPLNSPFLTSRNKYNAPMPSSMRISQKRANAVGKSGYKVGLPNSAPLSNKNYEPSNMRTHIRFVRSGGCVAPAKKGSIYNDSLRNGQVCSWGSIVRQNY